MENVSYSQGNQFICSGKNWGKVRNFENWCFWPTTMFFVRPLFVAHYWNLRGAVLSLGNEQSKAIYLINSSLNDLDAMSRQKLVLKIFNTPLIVLFSVNYLLLVGPAFCRTSLPQKEPERVWRPRETNWPRNYQVQLIWSKISLWSTRLNIVLIDWFTFIYLYNNILFKT